VAPSTIVPVDMTGAPAVSSSVRPAAPSSPERYKLQLQEAFLAQYSPDDGQVRIPGMCGV
jgi:hypothetical protein